MDIIGDRERVDRERKKDTLKTDREIERQRQREKRE